MSLSTQWRKECMVDPNIEFLNAGTLAPTLRSAFQAVYESQLKWMTGGPGGSLQVKTARAYLNMMEEQDKCRRVVAAWLGVEPASIALLGNATDGINAVLSSITWKKGDRILTSDDEHEALQQPLERLHRRFGVEIDVVPFPRNDEDMPYFMDRFVEHLSSATKMVAMSEVSHKSGVRVRVDDIIGALQQFPDVWLLMDGSHAAGTTTNLIRARTDFYVFPGHKWLFGPVETGVLWVSQRALNDTSPLLSGAPMMSAEGIRYDEGSGAWRYEYGTRDWSKMVGLSTAIEFRKQWTEEELGSHYSTLGAAFSHGFANVSSVKLNGVAPLYSFITDMSDLIANTLWEDHRVLVKSQDGSIRISLPPWIDSDRAHQLGQLIGEVVGS